MRGRRVGMVKGRRSRRRLWVGVSVLAALTATGCGSGLSHQELLSANSVAFEAGSATAGGARATAAPTADPAAPVAGSTASAGGQPAGDGAVAAGTAAAPAPAAR